MHPVLQHPPIGRIAVFRALVLGDLLCATPALRALKAAWPAAELTLIGLPWATELAARLTTVDRFEVFPGCSGLPEREPDADALPGFIARMRARRFDLLLQLHGSGRIVNPLLARFGARHVAGFADAGDFSAEPALHTVWPRAGHEIEHLLRLIDHLELPRQGTQLDLPVTDHDRERLARTVPELGPAESFACVHAGAQLPSRRWPLERFAAVADKLAASGLRIVLTGAAAERSLVAELRRLMRAETVDLAGRTDLFALGALLERARLLISNDTGVLHVAAALGTPSVSVSSGAEVPRWAPLNASRHHVLWRDLPCRPCAHRECPHGHECALGVTVHEVNEAARTVIATAVGVGAGVGVVVGAGVDT